MHPHGLVSLTEAVNTSLSTLAAKTALDINTDLSSLNTSFLLKRIRYFLTLENMVESEGPILVLASQGDAAANDVTSGMGVTNTVGPSDVTQSITQDQAWKVIRESVEMLQWTGEGVADLQSTGRWHRMPGKGIPMLAGGDVNGGIRYSVFNADVAALADTNSAIIKGMIEIQGVWLRD